MKRTLFFVAAGLALGTGPASLRAQAPDRVLRPFRGDDDRPIPRAQPALRPPQPMPESAVETAPPRSATPLPVRRAEPAKSNSTSKTASTPSTPAIEPADPAGEIRISPQMGVRAPDQVQLETADGYYFRKMYDMAAGEYQRYIEQYPSGADMQTALFRLAESYRSTGSLNAAKTNYDLLLSRSQAGDFVGPAAYRLADIYYQEKNYTFALPFYRKASLRLREKEPAVAMKARFFTARCLEALGGNGNRIEASDIYREVAEIKESNPFQEASRLSLALLLRESGRTADAVKQIKLLAAATEAPEVKAEATVRAGVWELELGQRTKAEEDLSSALNMPGIGRWKEAAQIGMLRLSFDDKKYQQVLDIYASSSTQFSPDSRAELMSLAASSQRRLGHVPEAMRLYDQLLKDYPLTVFGRDAAYDRVETLYEAEDEKVVGAIDDYLATAPDADKRDKVNLMKGEALYKVQKYAAAAPIYGAVSKSRDLPPVLKAEALFKYGWCSMQTRSFDTAIAAFTELIDSHPTFKSLSLALAQRAVAYQSQKNLPAAEKDYTQLIKKYPKAKERELALQQKALIRGDQNDTAGMIENFETLLRDYPKSAAAAEAHFWIGRSAYDQKDYKRAADQLGQAREMERERYFERASLPLMLSYYYLSDRAATAREVDLYTKDGKGKVPEEILRWLGDQAIETNQLEVAEKYLALLTGRETAAPKDFLKLGQVQFKEQKFKESAETLNRYLPTVKEPPSRALGLLDLARAQIGGKDFSGAQKSVDEALTLQPEGRLSGEARILAGDIQAEQSSLDQAAKLYMSVAVTLGLDDEEVTPKALEKAVDAYQKAGKEAEAKKTLNTLKSRYPEYLQRKKVSQSP